jgi:hypothetical protein
VTTARHVFLFCTDQATHPARELGQLARTGDGRVRLLPTRHPKHLAHAGEAVDGTLQVRCPTCRRTVPLRQETARRLLDTLTGPAVRRLDISRL